MAWNMQQISSLLNLNPPSPRINRLLSNSEVNLPDSTGCSTLLYTLLSILLYITLYITLHYSLNYWKVTLPLRQTDSHLTQGPTVIALIHLEIFQTNCDFFNWLELKSYWSAGNPPVGDQLVIHCYVINWWSTSDWSAGDPPVTEQLLIHWGLISWWSTSNWSADDPLVTDQLMIHHWLISWWSTTDSSADDPPVTD